MCIKACYDEKKKTKQNKNPPEWEKTFMSHILIIVYYPEYINIISTSQQQKGKKMFYVNMYFTILDFYYFLIFIYLVVPGLSCSV